MMTESKYLMGLVGSSRGHEIFDGSYRVVPIDFVFAVVPVAVPRGRR